MIQVFDCPCDPARWLVYKYWHYFTLFKWRLPFPLINNTISSEEKWILLMQAAPHRAQSAPSQRASGCCAPSPFRAAGRDTPCPESRLTPPCQLHPFLCMPPLLGEPRVMMFFVWPGQSNLGYLGLFTGPRFSFYFFK
jgi:hypothetical protein